MAGSKFIPSENPKLILDSILILFNRRHVFDDLQPYVCILESCVTPNRVFTNRRAWEDHLRQEGGSFVGQNVCPLCHVDLPSPQKWRSHVGREMQQLALFAIPKEMYSRDEDDDSEDESDNHNVQSDNDSVLSQGHVTQALLAEPSEADQNKQIQNIYGDGQKLNLDEPSLEPEPFSPIHNYLSTMEKMDAHDLNISALDPETNSHVQAYPRVSDDSPLSPEATRSSMRRSRSLDHSPAPNLYVYTNQQIDVEEETKAKAERDRIKLEIERKEEEEEEERKELLTKHDAEEIVEKELNEEARAKKGELDQEIADVKAEYEAKMSERNRIRLEIERKEKEEEEERKALLTKYEAEETVKKKLNEEAAGNAVAEWEKKKAYDKARKEALIEKFRLEETEAKAERKRIELEIERKYGEEEEERKELTNEAVKKLDEEAEAKAIAKWEKKKADEKAKDEALIEKFRLEEAEAKAQRNRIKLEIEPTEREEGEEEEEKIKKEKKLDDEMHKKLAVFGLQENQIEAILEPSKASNLQTDSTPQNLRPALDWSAATPTYVKAHRKHIDIDTLKYFGLPWEYDAVSTPFHHLKKAHGTSTNMNHRGIQIIL
jgi:hypothetical protein